MDCIIEVHPDNYDRLVPSVGQARVVCIPTIRILESLADLLPEVDVC